MDAAETLMRPTRPPAEANWPDFVDTYGRVILEWFREAGLPEPDVESLVSLLLICLGREFAQYSAQQSLRFRTWLQAAGRAAWGELIKGKIKASNPHRPSPVNDLLLNEAAHDEFLKALDAECAHQRRREVLPRVQAVADPTDWDSFYRVVLADVPVGEVAAEARCPSHSIRAAVFRVYRMLEDQYQRADELY